MCKIKIYIQCEYYILGNYCVRKFYRNVRFTTPDWLNRVNSENVIPIEKILLQQLRHAYFQGPIQEGAALKVLIQLFKNAKLHTITFDRCTITEGFSIIDQFSATIMFKECKIRCFPKFNPGTCVILQNIETESNVAISQYGNGVTVISVEKTGIHTEVVDHYPQPVPDNYDYSDIHAMQGFRSRVIKL